MPLDIVRVKNYHLTLSYLIPCAVDRYEIKILKCHSNVLRHEWKYFIS